MTSAQPERPSPRIVRPCCGSTAHDYLRSVGAAFVPHKRSCRYFRGADAPAWFLAALDAAAARKGSQHA